MMTLVDKCVFCGKEFSVEVREEDFFAWEMGGLVQECFPYLSADEREFLISRICPTCWKKTFG